MSVSILKLRKTRNRVVFVDIPALKLEALQASMGIHHLSYFEKILNAIRDVFLLSQYPFGIALLTPCSQESYTKKM